VPKGRDATKTGEVYSLFQFFKIKHATHPNPGQIKNTILAQRERVRERGKSRQKKRKRELVGRVKSLTRLVGQQLKPAIKFAGHQHPPRCYPAALVHLNSCF